LPNSSDIAIEVPPTFVTMFACRGVSSVTALRVIVWIAFHFRNSDLVARLAEAGHGASRRHQHARVRHASDIGDAADRVEVHGLIVRRAEKAIARASRTSREAHDRSARVGAECSEV
jgi:uncharacterized metal-binding protein